MSVDLILRRYMAAFEASDTAALAALLRDDIDYEMPPFGLWFHGVSDRKSVV